MNDELFVRDLMTPHVITLEADDNLDLADMIMRTARIRHLPVVSQGKLVGLVTHRDLLKASVSSIVRVPEKDEVAFRQRIRARQIMTTDILVAKTDETALSAARQLAEKRVGCLIVIHDDETLAGIITESDFLQLAIKALESIEDEQA
ncbi:MAG: hypothetical protein AUK47_08410 [Deltaproteobacteria bacterium CG2_30_63_29]|nr:MAG: hypothetical protein AUK47_08410 [Deltaproteobacteria bacterium CG2_30_63_29]PJB48614.1 MAG: hypothetical protein CO108_02070 [Deltaproteobacteria bacterium CG_4_9_14_3_um_filter_63_12]